MVTACISETGGGGGGGGKLSRFCLVGVPSAEGGAGGGSLGRLVGVPTLLPGRSAGFCCCCSGSPPKRAGAMGKLVGCC